MLNTQTLAGFSGSEQFTKYLGGLLLTDGARYLAENGGTGENGSAWWLMDIVASYRCVPAVRREPFQVYKLIKNKRGSGAKVEVEDGNGKVVYRQRIPYTDFDFANGGSVFAFWCVNGTVMLPGEY